MARTQVAPPESHHDQAVFQRSGPPTRGPSIPVALPTLPTWAIGKEAVHSRRSPRSGLVASVLEFDDFGIDGSRRWLRDRRGAFGYLLGTLPASRKSAASVITGLDQAGFVGEDDGLGPVAEAELGEQVGEVRL